MHSYRTPPLYSLRAFCIAARHGSFKSAADELALTPSAISHQMKQLGEALGARLFERKAGVLALTTAGHALANDITPIMEMMDQSLAQFSRRTQRHQVRMLLPPFFASELFVPRLKSFCGKHPDIDIQIDTVDPWPSDHPPGADLSIILTDVAPSGFNAVRLFPATLAAACARSFAPAVARLGREAFRETALIVQKARPFAWARWANELGLDPPEPRNFIELDNMYAVVRAAERGVGIALVPELLCDAWFRSGDLVRLFTLPLETGDAYFLVSRLKDGEKPAVAAITNWLLQQFAHRNSKELCAVRDAVGSLSGPDLHS